MYYFDSMRNIIITFFPLCGPFPDTAPAWSHMVELKNTIWKWILLISHLLCFSNALTHQSDSLWYNYFLLYEFLCRRYQSCSLNVLFFRLQILMSVKITWFAIHLLLSLGNTSKSDLKIILKLTELSFNKCYF